MSDLFSCASCKYNDGQKCTMFGRVIGMHGCSNGEPKKPKTYADKIRTMTDEELAYFLTKTMPLFFYCFRQSQIGTVTEAATADTIAKLLGKEIKDDNI